MWSGCAVVRVEGCFACWEVLEAVLLPQTTCDAPTTLPTISFGVFVLFCSQEEATKHLVLFTARGDNRSSASGFPQQASGRCKAGIQTE